MDGVIIDSNPVHTEAWASYLSQLGISADRIEKRMLGKHNDAIVRDFIGSSLNQKEITEHGVRKEALYRELMRPQLKHRLVPGVEAFLKSWNRTPLAVASNAIGPNVDFVLDEGGLRGFFRAVLNAQQISHPKPHPEIYLRTADLVGVLPSECVVIEDSDTGVEAARASGATVLGMSRDGRRLEGVALQVCDFLDPALGNWLSKQTFVAA